MPPFTTGSVPVALATGMLVQLLRLPEAGVPNTGVVSVGDVRLALVSVGDCDSTTLPVPVDVLTPVPPFATGRIPVTEEAGSAVQLDRFPDKGVPSVGEVKVGEERAGEF